MQHIKTEEENQKGQILDKIKEALAYLNIKADLTLLTNLSSEELETKLRGIYQIIAMTKGITKDMFQSLISNNYSQARKEIIASTLLSDESFDTQLLKLCLTDGAEDIDIVNIYSKINAAKEIDKKIKESNKPDYTMSLEEQKELPTDEDNEKIIKAILTNRYTEINKDIQDTANRANEKNRLTK